MSDRQGWTNRRNGATLVAIAMHFGFQLVQTQRLTLRHEMTVHGDMVRSLFKQTELLLRGSEYQKALQFVASKKKMELYRDMIDFLFCELVVGWKAHCMRFYADEGPPLRDAPEATPEQIAEWDIFLASSLHIAHEALEQQRRLTWCQLRTTTRAAVTLVRDAENEGGRPSLARPATTDQRRVEEIDDDVDDDLDVLTPSGCA